MLFLINKKDNHSLQIEVNNSIKTKILVFTKQDILSKDTTELVKTVKVEIPKQFNMDRRDYFKFINHLSGSINDYKLYFKKALNT